MNELTIRRMDYDSRTSYGEHAHNETQITLFLSGHAEEWVDDDRRLIGPLDVVIKPAGLRHSNRFGGQGASTLQMSVGPNWIESAVKGINQYQTTFCPLINFRFLRIYSGLAQSQEQPVRSRELIDLLKEVIQPATPKPERRVPFWLDSIFRDVNQNYRQTVCVQKLARRHDRHPVSVARAFRAHYGSSVKQRVHQLRVKLAAKLLGEKELKADAISHTCGFSDQSHMSRVFKANTGMPPVEFRRMLHRKTL